MAGEIPEGYSLAIHQDMDAADPRTEFDHVGHLVLSHRRYDLPHEDEHGVDAALSRGGARVALRYLDVVHDAVAVPVWGYEHGQLTITAGDRVGQYADRFDSGLAGLAYITRSEMTAAWLGRYPGDDAAVELLTAEVAEYDQYLRGDVWGYVVQRWQPCSGPCEHCAGGEWVHVDSCWGMYGHQYATTEGMAVISAEVEEGL